jgi:spore germination cell wall hydrolase CwlJ-like protein
MVKSVRYIAITLTILLFAIIFKTYMSNKLEHLSLAIGLDNLEIVTAAERQRQLECLAINIYKEAGYEPFEGKVAVGQVTMNRVEHPAFPDDVCHVVYEKNNWSGRIVCQFSWYCDHVHKNRPLGKKYEESVNVAKMVLLENFRLPSLENALFYHADYVNPNWKYTRITQVGRHIFYKPRVKGNNNV